MRKVLLGTGLVAAALTASADAGFLGFAARSDVVTIGANNYTRIDVYAMFAAADEKVLNVFDTNITLTGATQFYQAGTGNNRGYDSGKFFDPETGQLTNAADSLVTVGELAPQFDEENGEWYIGNPVTNDLNFTNWQGASSLNPPVPLAGWYANPDATAATGYPNAAAAVAGLTDNNTGSNLGVWIGRFSVAGLPDTSSRLLNFTAKLKWNLIGQTGSETAQDSEIFKYVPTPGAMALLGLAGLAGRRRRA